jgi:hypothetical protein
VDVLPRDKHVGERTLEVLLVSVGYLHPELHISGLILVGSILPGKAKSIELDVSPVILFRSTAGHVHLKCSVKRRDAT